MNESTLSICKSSNLIKFSNFSVILGSISNRFSKSDNEENISLLKGCSEHKPENSKKIITIIILPFSDIISNHSLKNQIEWQRLLWFLELM